MELINFATAQPAIKSKAWEVYNGSFPAYEKRSAKAHEKALEDEEFYAKVAVGEEGLLGILFYWVHGEMLYVEHIAVNPELRGRNIGSRLLERLVAENSDLRIILEIDPPVDEISVRRLGFYERLGFVRNEYEFLHPSYSSGKNAHPHELVIMSHGRAISDEEFGEFKEYLYGVLTKYVD